MNGTQKKRVYILIFSFLVVLIAISVFIHANDKHSYIAWDMNISKEDKWYTLHHDEYDSFLIPNDTILETMDEYAMYKAYWKYVTHVQNLCKRKLRLGSVYGGKFLCEDETFKPVEPCLMYSFGSAFEFSFEEEFFKRYGCEIHTFDPSRPIGNRTLPMVTKFHLIGLGGEDTTNALGWKIQTLNSIMHSLNHTDRIIDVLKIDIEGAQWESLAQMYKTGILKYVKQICIEIEFGRNMHGKREKDGNLPLWGGVPFMFQIRTLREIFMQGFRIINQETVGYGNIPRREKKGPVISSQTEITLINMRWMKRDN